MELDAVPEGVAREEALPGRGVPWIDLDTCRAPDGHFAAWAQQIIERFGSYTEVSPSTTGAKIFFLYRTAELPALRAVMGGLQHGREAYE